MAGQFMPLFDNISNQLRITLGNPTQGEKSRLDVSKRKHFEDDVDIALHAAFTGIPLGTRDVRRKC